MASPQLPEVWLRGPLQDVPPLLQPIAHALLQAKEEVETLMKDFPGELLMKRPADVASPAFHLQHVTGVIDRLFTYAEGSLLSEEQLAALRLEGQPGTFTVSELVQRFHQKVDWAIDQLKKADETTLTEYRGVGRAQLPSTRIGLYTHAAEHTMRHLGQLLVTVKVLKNLLPA